jgi:hypothetical protein
MRLSIVRISMVAALPLLAACGAEPVTTTPSSVIGGTGSATAGTGQLQGERASTIDPTVLRQGGGRTAGTGQLQGERSSTIDPTIVPQGGNRTAGTGVMQGPNEQPFTQVPGVTTPRR